MIIYKSQFVRIAFTNSFDPKNRILKALRSYLHLLKNVDLIFSNFESDLLSGPFVYNLCHGIRRGGVWLEESLLKVRQPELSDADTQVAVHVSLAVAALVGLDLEDEVEVVIFNMAIKGLLGW